MLRPKSPQTSFYGSYTISTVWYGDCRNSTGDLGTDKLFTGQRLDGTDLYYYGARYYDPTIGRFISPDSIVQNPANPQTLNRYSYCLNNPLKYVDPSGLRVYIGRTDVSVLKDILDQINQAEEFGCDPSAALMAAFWDAYNGLGENWVDLFDAWEKFGSVEPEMAGILEESAITFTIGAGSIKDSISMITGIRGGTSATITLDLGKIGSEGVNGAVWVFAHEAMHGAVWDYLGFVTGEGSRYEETVACQYQRGVGLKYGYAPKPSFFGTPIEHAAVAVSLAMHIDLSKEPRVNQWPSSMTWWGWGWINGSPYGQLPNYPQGQQQLAAITSLSGTFVLGR